MIRQLVNPDPALRPSLTDIMYDEEDEFLNMSNRRWTDDGPVGRQTFINPWADEHGLCKNGRELWEALEEWEKQQNA